MFKHKKAIIIVCSIIFLLTALTIYANKVLFPTIIKKMTIEQAQAFLKRKVEIESLHLNWFRGFVVDKIKVYQKDSSDVFIQAKRVSFGVIFIPGVKQHKINIPFINIEEPAAHLIHIDKNTWNFSDILSAASAPAAATNAKDQTPEKPSPFVVSLAGINIIDGQMRLDDLSTTPNRSEVFDQINLKVSLSLKGIAYDFSANLPQKHGSLGAKGHYQPLSQDVDTTFKIDNIDLTSYSSLVSIPDLNLTSGIINNVDGRLFYSKDKIEVDANAVVQKIDVRFKDQAIKGDFELKDFSAQLANGGGPILTSGTVIITNSAIAVPGVSASGTWQAHINTFKMDHELMDFDGSLTGKGGIKLSDKQTIDGNFNIQNVKLRKDKDGAQVVGQIQANNFNAVWFNQTASGTLTVKPLVVKAPNEHTISIEGALDAQKLSVGIDEHKHFDGNVKVDDLKLSITNSKDIDGTAQIKISEMNAVLDQSMSAQGNVDLKDVHVQLSDDTLKAKANVDLTAGVIQLDSQKVLNIAPRIKINAIVPLKNPSAAQYDGHLDLEGGEVKGFPFSPFKNINCSADFKTDELDIASLSLNVLDTDLNASGSVLNFNKPVLNISAEAQKLDLGKLKEVMPELMKQYGLNVTGEAGFKLKFEGLASDPLSAKIQANAALRQVNISSTTFNQSVSDISGAIEATGDSLSWKDFKATYLGKSYTLTGQLNDFKNPKVTTSLDGEDVQLQADVNKSGDIVTINNLKGKYLTFGFDAKGNVNMATKTPTVDVDSTLNFNIEDVLKFLPADQKKNIEQLKPSGALKVVSSVKGIPQDWKNLDVKATLSSPQVTVMEYKLNNFNLNITENDGKIQNAVLDSNVYDGKVHAVGSVDLKVPSMPFDLALNIDEVDMHKLKMDSPLKSEEINGKFYLTTVVQGSAIDPKSLKGKGSMAIREGFLTEFKFFKGLLTILNSVMHLAQVTITDVEANFAIENQKITTDSLRMKSPTLTLLGEGWVDFDQNCDIAITVDMTTNVPLTAEEVLRTLKVRIHDKISNPKYEQKISVPQVINTILKNIL